MTTIILVSIGIILASLSALMMVFYGGERFGQDRAKAEAHTLLNAGANIRSGANVFMVTRGKLPRDFAELRDARGVSQMPQIAGIGTPAVAWRDFGSEGERPRKAFVVTGVRDDVCGYVNTNLVSRSARGIQSAPSGLTGCYKENGANVYFAMLSDAAAGAPLTSCDNPPTTQDDVAIDAQICYVKKVIPLALARAQRGEFNGRDITSSYINGVYKFPVDGIRVFDDTTVYDRDSRVLQVMIPYNFLSSKFCQRWNKSSRAIGVSDCDGSSYNFIQIRFDPLHASCGAMQADTLMNGSYGADVREYISAYNVGEAKQACDYFAYKYGAGVCGWTPERLYVGYRIGGVTSQPPYNASYATTCSGTTAAPVAKPARNATSGATCEAAFHEGRSSIDTSTASATVVDERTAQAQCSAWGAQYGEGSCDYAPWSGDVTYRSGGYSRNVYVGGGRSLQCR